MKKCLFLFALLFVSISLEAVNGDWRVIKNKLYSLELPANWIPQSGMPGDGTEPGMREVRDFHIYYFAWHTPAKDKSEMPTIVGIDIQTYEKKDRTTISLEEAKKILIPPSEQIKEVHSSSANELRGTRTKKSKEMDGSIVEYRLFNLLKQKGSKVHRVSISLREELYAKSPNIKKQITHILDSFVAN